jgi:hypothetical protein
MTTKIAGQFNAMLDDAANIGASPMEFEMAYHARVGIDRIRFAIRHTDEFARHSGPWREVGMQLLDALERLESVDRRFQNRASGRATRAAAGFARGERQSKSG